MLDDEFSVIVTRSHSSSIQLSVTVAAPEIEARYRSNIADPKATVKRNG